MKKKYIITIVVLTLISVYGLIVYNLSIKSELGESSNNIPENTQENDDSTEFDYLIVGNDECWIYNNGHWNETEPRDFDESFSVYVNNNYFGDYKLKYGNVWNLFDTTNKYVHYNGKLLAVTSGISVNLMNYNIQNVNIDDMLEIDMILNSNILQEDLTINEKLILDLDKNGINDKIINVSNLDAENQNIYFNLTYINLNNNLKILNKNIVEIENRLIEPVYNLEYVLNINNSEYDSIILRKGYFSNNGDTQRILYEYNNENYLEIVGD